MSHTSVLLVEAIEGLKLLTGETAVDATGGEGGHSRAILSRLGLAGTLLVIDEDEDALEKVQKNLEGILEGAPRVFLKQANFRNLDAVLSECGISTVNKVLFDLGLSTNQLEASGRGFSFKRDEPLIMTFAKTREGLTAADIVNSWSAEAIANMIFEFGEERFSRRIAKAIVEARARQAIVGTRALADIVRRAVPIWYRRGRLDPATKTFQALRIAVNDELAALHEGLESAFRHLAPLGRIAVISFHSLEDRIVKQFFVRLVQEGHGSHFSKKPIVPAREEILANPRSRSAKLRIFIKN